MKQLLSAVLAGIFVVALVLFYGWVIAWAWNITLPVIFGLPAITTGQAIALSMLLGFITSFFKREK